jgi:RNA polymerase sigma factor (sigma-70 family)
VTPVDPPEDLHSGDFAPEDRASTVSKLFREHNRTLVGFLFARLRNEQEAREIAQEAYVKVLQLEPKPGAARFMRSYLFRVAENLAVDRVRQRRSRSRLDELNATGELFQEDLTERGAIADQELALLRRAVAELPDKCGEAFRLHWCAWRIHFALKTM